MVGVGLADQYVLRLQIQMHQFLIKQLQEGRIHLHDKTHQFLLGKDSLCDLLAKRSRTFLHDQVKRIFRGVINR